jgi:hypothetical protein
MIQPPRNFPEGVLQLYRVEDDKKYLIQELKTSSKNRERIQQMRNDMLMLDSTLKLEVSENNCVKFTPQNNA